MFFVFALAAPYLLAQAISPRRAILRVEPASVVLLITAVGIQLAAALDPFVARIAVPVSFFLGTIAITLVAWASSHRRLPTGLALGGGLANLIPISVHGAMPVSISSRELVSTTPSDEPALLSAKHSEAIVELQWVDPSSWLADWIPLTWLNAVVSPGDVALLGALFVLAVHSANVDDAQDHIAPYAENNADAGSFATT